MCIYMCICVFLVFCCLTSFPYLMLLCSSLFFFSPSFILFFFPSWQLKQRNKIRSGWAFTVHVRFFFFFFFDMAAANSS